MKIYLFSLPIQYLFTPDCKPFSVSYLSMGTVEQACWRTGSSRGFPVWTSWVQLGIISRLFLYFAVSEHQHWYNKYLWMLGPGVTPQHGVRNVFVKCVSILVKRMKRDSVAMRKKVVTRNRGKHPRKHQAIVSVVWSLVICDVAPGMRITGRTDMWRQVARATSVGNTVPGVQCFVWFCGGRKNFTAGHLQWVGGQTSVGGHFYFTHDVCTSRWEVPVWVVIFS